MLTIGEIRKGSPHSTIRPSRSNWKRGFKASWLQGSPAECSQSIRALPSGGEPSLPRQRKILTARCQSLMDCLPQPHYITTLHSLPATSRICSAPVFAFSTLGHNAGRRKKAGEKGRVAPQSIRKFPNVWTGERLTSPNGRSLLCREIFAHFPVALLALR